MILSNACFAKTHVFISFSMPKESIKQWISQADKANAQVYLRGFINDSFKQTMLEASFLVNENSREGFLLEPKLFEKFKIEKVPAVVFVEDNQEYVVVYGDIGLKAAAESAMSRQHSDAAKKVFHDL